MPILMLWNLLSDKSLLSYYYLEHFRPATKLYINGFLEFEIENKYLSQEEV